MGEGLHLPWRSLMERSSARLPIAVLVVASIVVAMLYLRGGFGEVMAIEAPSSAPSVHLVPIPVGGVGANQTSLNPVRTISPIQDSLEVVDVGGRPIREAWCRYVEGERQRTASLDDPILGGSDGRIVLPSEGQSGDLVSVSASGFQSKVVEVQNGATLVILEHGASLTVRVSDSRGAPVSGADVVLSATALPCLEKQLDSIQQEACGEAVLAIHRAATNEVGAVVFDALVPGPQNIQVTKPGWIVSEMQPALPMAPGFVAVQLKQFIVVGVSVQGGVPLSVDIEGVPGQAFLSSVTDLTRRTLTRKHDLFWMTMLQVDPEDVKGLPPARAYILVEGYGWLGVNLRYQLASEFEPDVIQVPTSIAPVAGGLVRIRAPNGDLGGYASIDVSPVVILRPQDPVGVTGGDRRMGSILLGIGDDLLLPEGVYGVRFRSGFKSLLESSESLVNVRAGGEVTVDITKRQEFSEVGFRLQDADGNDQPAGYFRIRSPTFSYAAYVFDWATATACVPLGDYKLLMQGMDGSIARREIAVGVWAPEDEPIEFTFRADAK